MNRLLFMLSFLLISCTKETKLKNNYLVNNKIFCVSYLSTQANVSGIKILGTNLLEKGISAYLKYDDTLFVIDLKPSIMSDKNSEILESKFDFIQFKPLKSVEIVCKINKSNDSIILKSVIPDSINTSHKISYLNQNEFKIDLRTLNDKSENYYFLTSFNIYYQSVRSSISGSTSRLDFNNLPELISKDDKLNINGFTYNQLSNGIKLPITNFSTYNQECLFLPHNQIYKYGIHKCSFDDAEYIKSMADNNLNKGNPFFIQYQAKNITENSNKTIQGKIVCASYKIIDNIKINDPSDTITTIKLIDNLGNNILGNPNYRISSSFFNHNNQYLFLQKNAFIKFFYNCNSNISSENKAISSIQVLNVITKKTKSYNVDLNPTKRTNYIFTIE